VATEWLLDSSSSNVESCVDVEDSDVLRVRGKLLSPNFSSSSNTDSGIEAKGSDVLRVKGKLLDPLCDIYPMGKIAPVIL